MRQGNQHEICNPSNECVDGLAAPERADMEGARAWAHHLNGGGDPKHFDYDGWLKTQQRGHQDRCADGTRR
jgi:hypothetical protein